MKRFAHLLTLGLLAGAAAPLAAQNTNPHATWHWHMHQPIYWNDQLESGTDRYEYAWDSIQATDGGRAHPENNLREIFGKDDRRIGYQWGMRDSLAGISGHADSGASVSYSGALAENVGSLGAAQQLGYQTNWSSAINEANEWNTTDGHPRMDLVNFSFHHALLPLHDAETVRMELLLHREKVKEVWGTDALSRGLFPTEMAFSTRLIPVLEEVGIEWSIVSGEHIARACPDFPLILGTGGVNCEPPNPADQINPNGVIFTRDQIDRGCSPVNANPLSYQPAYVKYIDPETGTESSVISIPADQVWSWRNGYAAHDAEFMKDLTARNDPAQPSLVLMAHDGDNAWGGGSSYYNEAVPNFANDAASEGFAVSTIEQYLEDFTPPTSSVIHVEDGAWVNADGDFGSPTYINWNYPLLDSSYKVDPINGWHEKPRDYAIFTAALNRVLTAEQMSGHTPDLQKILHPDGSTHDVDRAWHYFLGSLDSGNVYYGAALDMEVKATIGCNEAVEHADAIINARRAADLTPPSVWTLQRWPYNPGGQNFGNAHGYQIYYDDGDFVIWTFASDVSGMQSVNLKYRIDVDGVNPLDSSQNETFAGGAEGGEWQTLAMNQRTFPKDDPTNNPSLDFFELPDYIADHYSVEVKDLRDVLIDYYVEATDTAGNVKKTDIYHVYIGDGSGSGGEETDRVTLDPNPPQAGQTLTITYDASSTSLDGAADVCIHRGKNDWQSLVDEPMTHVAGNDWITTITLDADTSQLDFVFNDCVPNVWDNNGGNDWHFAVEGSTQPTPTPTPTPGPDQPFVMDGTIDAAACEITGGLYLAVAEGWLYIATDQVTSVDGFLYVSADPSTLQSANWGKAGQVGKWDYFLAAESNNDYSSWFSSNQTGLTDDSNLYVHARSGTILEGAIRLSLIGETETYAALGLFGTNDSEPLLGQAPASLDSDGDLDGAEYRHIVVGLSPCQDGPIPNGWILR
ncbi:hypothetical protein KQI84_03340 [bacterium]|nr:hypothetical protein [bacterium]